MIGTIRLIEPKAKIETIKPRGKFKKAKIQKIFKNFEFAQTLIT